MAQAKLDSEIRTLIETILAEKLGRFGLSRTDIHVDADHDGDDSLFIDVRYGSDGDPIDPTVMADLVGRLRRQLWDAGEERFPYIRHYFPEKRQIIDRK